MLNHVFAWWRRQIMALVPPRFRRAETAPDALVVAVDKLEHDAPPSGTIYIRRNGAETFVARLPERGPPGVAAGRLATALRLPADQVLQRKVFLPLAAERDVHQVLGFEMDRLTPFQPEEIFWGVAELRRDPVQGLRITLLITLREPVERLLGALAGLSLKPEFLETEGGRIVIGNGGLKRGRRLQMALYGLCGVLALTCLTIPLVEQQIALSNVQTEIAQLQPTQQEALKLRNQLAIAASGSSAISAAARGGDMLQMLAALTSVLPDGTYLTDIAWKTGDLTIDGQSSDAARLIAILASAPGFHDPRFVAPVTRAMNGQADLFSIHATASP